MPTSRKQSVLSREIFNSPYKLLTYFVITILLVDLGTELIKVFLSPQDIMVAILSDGLFLVLLLAPALYFLVLRPMIRYASQQKKAEDELIVAKEYAESLVRIANVIIVGLNETGEIKSMNETAEKITGYSYEELKGKNLFETLVPKKKYPQVWKEFISPTLTGNISDTFENPILTKNGEERYISWQNGLLYEGGKISGTISYGIDITERKKSDEDISKFKLGFEYSTDAIFMANPKGEITYANSAFTKTYGFSNEETIGRTPRILKSGLLAPEVYENYWATLLDKQIIAGEIVNKTKDGRFITIDGSNNPILSASGDIIGFLSIHRDVTERKQLELEREVQSEIVHGVTTTANLDELLLLIHRSLKKVLYAENCFFALYDPDTQLFSFPYFVDQFDEAPAPMALEKSCTAYIFRAGKSLLIDKKLFEQLKEENEVELVGSNSPSWIGVPLQTSDRIIGVLVLQHYEKENVYNEDHLRFLDSIGSQVANVIERKRAEDDLEKSFSLLSATLESTADGILVVDNNGKISNFNKKFIELWRIPEPIISTRDDAKIMAFVLDQLKDPIGFVNKVNALYLNDQEISFDILEFNDGRTFERISQAQLFEGRSVGRVWSFHDITKIVSAQRELRESEEKFRTFFEKSPIGIEIYDAMGIQVDANPASLGMFGIADKSSVLGFNIFEGTSLNEDLKKQLQHGITIEYTAVFNFDKIRELNQYQTSHSGEADMLYSITPIKSNEGEKILGYLLLVQNITERKQAEKALRESETRLHELNATKDKFFSIIAHDLRSPFNSIEGFSSHLVQQVRDKDYKGIEEYAAIIQTSSKRAMNLLSNLMEWSLSQTGRIAFNPAYIEMVSLISEVTELLADTAIQKSITIEKKLPLNAFVYADKAMISTVFRNLISNAIKFTNPGGKVVVSVELKKDELLAAVSDSGIGIKRESIEKLFKIDESYSTSGTQNEKGTGLGLILCKEFVEKHGGKIRIESEVGTGTVIYFTIPVH